MFQDIQKAAGGAIIGALLTVSAFLFGAGGSTSTPTPVPPSAPALESGQSVVYFCKPDIQEIIDNTVPGAIPSAVDPGRAKVIHTCKAPDGSIVRVDATGKFIEAKDTKGLPLTESQAREYLR